VTLVSVITPTWQRHDLLMQRCIPAVFEQTYSEIEHVIVSDGPDRALAETLALDLWRRPLKTRPLRYDQLPEHIVGSHVDYGSRARNRGLVVATGTYVAYLDDDNTWRPDHLKLLVEALETSGADFAYSQMIRHPLGDTIGADPPREGQIDTSLIVHRAGLPQRCGMWPLPDELTGDKHAPDWGVVARWLHAGATWIHVPTITTDYYLR
jgi:glycosyltransferase involved in cell wall biosynthesis